MRNVLTRVPKSAEGLVATTVRTIFQQPSAEAVHAQLTTHDPERDGSVTTGAC